MLGPHRVLPVTISCPVLFPESCQRSEISSISKVILVVGKARSLRAPNLGRRGPESRGWFDVSPKNCIRCDAQTGLLSWWSCQSPVAWSFSLLNHPNSFCRGVFELNAEFDADLLLYLLSHFECDGCTVYMLTQQCLVPPLTSTVRLSLFMHTHFSSLSLAARLRWCCTNCSCYINNGWTFSGQTSYSVYRSFTYLIKFILKYFWCYCKRDLKKISSYSLSLVYRNTTDSLYWFYILQFYQICLF